MNILRLHVLPQAGISEAARFITGALLLSHGARRDTAALVRVGDSWILARGGGIRHLRPDADTAEGWVRAVLRGARLGGEVMSRPPPPVGRIILVSGGSGRGLAGLSSPPATLCYGSCPYAWEDVVEGFDDAWRSVVVANIVLDRFERGLGGCG